MMRFLDQLFCGWFTGHRYMPQFIDTPPEKRWVCTKCLKQRHGWMVDAKPPRKRFEGDQARHQMQRRTSV